jgi:hypothetical protein
VADDLDFLLGDLRHVQNLGELAERFLRPGLHFGRTEVEGQVRLEPHHAQAFIVLEQVGILGGQVEEGAVDGFGQGRGALAEGEQFVILLLQVGKLLGEQVAFALQGAQVAGVIEQAIELGDLGFQLADLLPRGIQVVLRLRQLGAGLIEGRLQAFVFVHRDATGGARQAGHDGCKR